MKRHFSEARRRTMLRHPLPHRVLTRGERLLAFDAKFKRMGKVVAALVCFLLFVTGLGCLVAAAWIYRHFGEVTLSRAWFHLVYPLKGADPTIFPSVCRHLVYAVILPGLGCLWYYFNPWGTFSFVLNLAEEIVHEAFLFLKKCRFFIFMTAGLTLFITGTLVFLHRLDVFTVLRQQMEKTALFNEYYYTPSPEEVTFPEKKNNLIVIFLESMENTYERSELSPDGKPLIPELEALQKKNFSFPHQLQLNGMGWTAGAINTYAYGLPVLMNLWFKPLSAQTDGAHDATRTIKLFSHCTSIYDVLAAHGYHIISLRGASLQFAGMGTILQDVENCTQYGLEQLKDEPDYTAIPESRRNPWGLHDEILLKVAKRKIIEAAARPDPFCFLIESVNTHGYDGYLPPEPGEKAVKKCAFPEVLRTNSRLFGSFVQWIREQPFGANTTIVLLGDHLTMANPLQERLCQFPMLPSGAAEEGGLRSRTIYNCFINPVWFPENVNREKYCSTFDLAPTLLEIMGARWKNHRFGIGTSILSNEPNVLSRYSPEQFNREVCKRSDFYRKLLLTPRGRKKKIERHL